MTAKTAKLINYLIIWFLRAVGVGLVAWFLALRECDLFADSFLYVPLWYLILTLISKPMKNLPRVRWLTATGFNLAVATSALLSGSWNKAFKVASNYFVGIHIHHLEWSSIGVVLRFFAMKVVFSAKTAAEKGGLFEKYAKRETWVGLAIAFFFVLSFFAEGLFPSITSSRITSGIAGGTALFMGWYLKATAKYLKTYGKTPEGFRRVMCTTYAILAGICFEGLLGFLGVDWGIGRHFDFGSFCK